MIKIIERTTALLKKVTSWYEKRNTEQAVKTLYSKQKYLAGFFTGFNTFLDHFTKYGAVITLALSVSSFLGFSMTPVGWITVGSAMLIGGIVLAAHSVYSYLDKSQKIMEAIETRDAHESQIKSLAQEIERQYAENDVLEKELRILRQSAEKLGISSELEIPSTSSANIQREPIDIAQNTEKKHTLIQTLKNLALYVATPFIVAGQFFNQWLQRLLPQLSELITATSPIQKRFKEFAAVLTFVTTAFTGLFTWLSSSLGGGLTQLSFLQTSAILAASLSPVTIGLIGAALLLVSGSLLLNKVFFSDPHEQLTTQLEERRVVLIDSLNQNQLLLSQIEYKNESLKEKVKLLTLKIDVVQNALKNKENKRAAVEGRESIELGELYTASQGKSNDTELDKQKLTDNISSLQKLLHQYQEQLGKLERKEALEKLDANVPSEESNIAELVPIDLNTRSSEGQGKSNLRKFSVFSNNAVRADHDDSLAPKNSTP
ncbi:hypothetical protein ACD661_02270 [Legionella lytica]|uniref:Inclusion membrane protein A n=1 Tax=Legionella lytica TaxID=96232 RepID=A0ABW8D3V1_9GAMM